MKKTVTCIFFFVLCLHCMAQQQQKKSGHVTITQYGYDDSSKVKKAIDFIPFDRPLQIWYKDSLIINECYRWMSEEVNDDSIKSWSFIDRYVFTDLKTKSFYEYSSMTDTAKLLQIYALPNHRTPTYNGFGPSGLYGENNDSSWFKNAVPIADTVIGNTVYGRYMFKTKLENGEFINTIYFDCSQKNTVLPWMKGVGDKLRCQVVRADEKNLSYPFRTFITEVEPVGTSLTSEQLKVFNAWEKYEKQNPVTQSMVYETPEEPTEYEPTLKDRLFGGSYDSAGFVSQKMANGNIRTLRKTKKTAEMAFNVYVLVETSSNDSIGDVVYVLSKNAVPKTSLTDCPMEHFGEIYLYQDGAFLSAGSENYRIKKNKLIAHFNNKRYKAETSCLKLIPLEEPGTNTPPACVDWYWTTWDDAGKVVKESFLFTSCDLVSWPGRPKTIAKLK